MPSSKRPWAATSRISAGLIMLLATQSMIRNWVVLVTAWSVRPLFWIHESAPLTRASPNTPTVP